MTARRLEADKGYLYFLGAIGAVVLASLAGQIRLSGVLSVLPGLLFAAGFAFSLFGLLHGVKSIRRREDRSLRWWVAVLGNGLVVLYFIGVVLYNEWYG